MIKLFVFVVITLVTSFSVEGMFHDEQLCINSSIWSGIINYYQPPVETLKSNYYVHQKMDENIYLRMAMGDLLAQSTLFENDVELQIKRMDKMLDSIQITREDSLFMKSLESSAGKFIRRLYNQFRTK